MVVLKNISDASGNMLRWPVTWNFTIGDYGPLTSSIAISGVKLSTTHAFYVTQSGQSETLRVQIARFLSVPSSRIANVVALDGYDKKTSISFVIKPPTNQTADTQAASALATKFIAAVGAIESINRSPFAAYDGLNRVVKSSEVRQDHTDRELISE